MNPAPENPMSGGHEGSHQPHGQTDDAYGNQIPADAKTLAVFAHLSSLLLSLFTAMTLSFLGPLVFWLIYKDKPGYGFVRACSANAFNFNVFVWIINAAAGLLVLLTFGVGLLIAVPVWGVAGILVIVFHTIGAVRAQRGEIYEYPMRLKILS